MNGKSKFSNIGTLEKSNINIKEIRKKFENLSTNDDFEINNEQSTSKIPIPPLRRNKSNPRESKIKPLDDKNSVKIETSGTPCERKPSVVKILDDKNSVKRETPGAPCERKLSVKERTKIFETNPPEFPTGELNSNTSETDSSRVPQNVHKQNTFYVNMEHNSQMLLTPPVKPPRSYHLSEMKNQASSHALKNISKTTANRRCSYNEPSKNHVPKPRNSSSFSSNSKVDKNDLCKSAKPDITESCSSLTPKSHNIAAKTHSIMNCLKNISIAANNIREKMKQSSVFVDLTPTTVSPPKHYGTLKRSHSEEHIYAEPYEILKKDIEKSPNVSKNGQPLHYMCTPLIKPKLPDKNPEKSRLSREHVRTMIYDSFAPLRTVPKENQESKDTFPDSSEADMKAIQARIIYVKSIRQVSGSSICLAPKLFEALYIINVTENQPEITHSFPLKVPETYRYPLLPHICFPNDLLFKSVSTYQSETFYFTLLDKGEKVWGYCLRITGWPDKGLDFDNLCVKLPVAICILSCFYAPLFYKRLLLEIEKHITLPRVKCFKYIRSLQKLGVPNAGASVSIPDYTESVEDNRVVISRPFDSHTVGLELTRALQLLDVDILVKTVSSLLLERRVLLISSCVNNLYHCCQAISHLLYPFEWPHTFIPVLPACLTVYCCSELPYIIGVLSSDYNSLLELLAEHELLILDVDKGIVIKSYNDEDTILPKKIQKAVIAALNLAKNMTDPTEMLRDIMISEAFVHMYVEMIGHYENHFIEQDENLIFQKDGLLKNAISHSIQTFLQWFSETQMFDTFISESIWRINYRKLCQTNLRTFFEKRVDEYKWELSHEEKFSRFIEKTKNFGGKLISKLKK